MFFETSMSFLSLMNLPMRFTEGFLVCKMEVLEVSPKTTWSLQDPKKARHPVMLGGDVETLLILWRSWDFRFRMWSRIPTRRSWPFLGVVCLYLHVGAVVASISRDVQRKWLRLRKESFLVSCVFCAYGIDLSMFCDRFSNYEGHFFHENCFIVTNTDPLWIMADLATKLRWTNSLYWLRTLRSIECRRVRLIPMIVQDVNQMNSPAMKMFEFKVNQVWRRRLFPCPGQLGIDETLLRPFGPTRLLNFSWWSRLVVSTALKQV